MKSYHEIMELLDTKESTEMYMKNLNSLFILCRDYYWNYQINEKVNPIKPVIKNYMDDENLITKDENYQSNYKKLEIVEKIYAGIYTEVYDKYYKKDIPWNYAISLDKTIDQIVSEHFINVDNQTKKNLKKTIYNVYSKADTDKKIKLDSLHNAMSKLSDILKTPVPTIEESVNAVIMGESLELLYSYIEHDNMIGLCFAIAPIRRALSIGEYKSYYRNETSHAQHYFNLKCEYNYEQLNSYINALTDLLNLYNETIDEFKNVFL